MFSGESLDICQHGQTLAEIILAEREGFEPSIPLRVCRISSAVLSTTQPPLRIARGAEEGWLVARHSAAIKGCHPPIPAGERPGRIIRRRQAAGRHLERGTHTSGCKYKIMFRSPHMCGIGAMTVASAFRSRVCRCNSAGASRARGSTHKDATADPAAGSWRRVATRRRD